MKILGQTAHWIINKDLAKEVGLEGALLLSDLIDKFSYFLERGEVTEDGFFYSTIENIEKDTTLTRKLQDKNIKILKENGYIETTLRGVPAKRHFKIRTNKIALFIQDCLPQKDKLDGPKKTTNKNKEIINNNNNKNNICAFNDFWTIYKRKIDKTKAEKKFNLLTEQEKILAVAGAKKWNKKWESDKTEIQFIPHPTTWLNNRRWEAEPPPTQKTNKKIPSNAYQDQPNSFLDGFNL